MKNKIIIFAVIISLVVFGNWWVFRRGDGFTEQQYQLITSNVIPGILMKDVKTRLRDFHFPRPQVTSVDNMAVLSYRFCDGEIWLYTTTGTRSALNDGIFSNAVYLIYTNIQIKSSEKKGL